ncbi:UNVERIFIED_CONTAM: inhibitor of the pro-sigma K processing machinery [Acetivibrio alkalicellulosi]
MYEEYGTIFAYIIGIVLLFFLGKFFIVPMKTVLKLLFSSILGAGIIFIINFLGGFFEFNIALNPITAFITGTLGVPGVLLLIALKYIFKA